MTVPPPPNPEVGRCSFFVAAKRRHCRFAAISGTDRCGNHPGTPDGEDLRIPCTLDPRHTVAKSKLSSHLKICSKRCQEEFLVRQPFYKKGVNIPSVCAKPKVTSDIEEMKLRVQSAYPKAMSAHE